MSVAAVSLALFAERPAVLFFGAHPDDTEGYAGLAFLLAKDYDLHVVDLTHGERGLGEEGLKDGSTARRRTREEESACALLGAKLHFLDEIDGEACAGKSAAEGLAKILRDAKPVAVFTHWPLDAHPDHMQCAALMANAIRLTGVKPEQYFYEVLFSQTRNWNPLYSVDITSVMSNKVGLLRKYVCQNPDDSIVREKLAQAEQRGRERVPPVRYAETFTTFDGKPWPGVLEKLPQTVRRLALDLRLDAGQAPKSAEGRLAAPLAHIRRF